ncbi:MAG: STAS domain-containing protein [Candidatus Eremiobacteraeota bacterium]|nr:STAS domain-containing protein [Candidatus Eremiobacteraeota bacterium]
MTDQATYQFRESNGIPVIEVTGELDVANIDDFRAFVRDATLPDGFSVIVSFERVSYFDSHALEALVEFSKRLHTNRRQLLVVAARESPPGRILRTANMDLALPLYESVEEARLATQ